MTDDHTARVRERAYQIWQAEGEPHGRDAEHWRQAEQESAAENAGTDGEVADREPTGDGNVTSASGATETVEAPAVTASSPAADDKAAVQGQGAERSDGSDDLESTTSRRRAPGKAAAPRGRR